MVSFKKPHSDISVGVTTKGDITKGYTKGCTKGGITKGVLRRRPLRICTCSAREKKHYRDKMEEYISKDKFDTTISYTSCSSDSGSDDGGDGGTHEGGEPEHVLWWEEWRGEEWGGEGDR